MSLHWAHDTDFADIFFDGFLSEYEQVGRSDTFKRAGYACKDLTVISINGYSHGDMAWIKVPHDDATKETIEYLTKIFYDQFMRAYRLKVAKITILANFMMIFMILAAKP